MQTEPLQTLNNDISFLFCHAGLYNTVMDGELCVFKTDISFLVILKRRLFCFTIHLRTAAANLFLFRGGKQYCKVRFSHCEQTISAPVWKNDIMFLVLRWPIALIASNNRRWDNSPRPVWIWLPEHSVHSRHFTLHAPFPRGQQRRYCSSTTRWTVKEF